MSESIIDMIEAEAQDLYKKMMNKFKKIRNNYLDIDTLRSDMKHVAGTYISSLPHVLDTGTIDMVYRTAWLMFVSDKLVKNHLGPIGCVLLLSEVYVNQE